MIFLVGEHCLALPQNSTLKQLFHRTHHITFTLEKNNHEK